jgi:transposase
MRHEKRPKVHDIVAALASLPSGQRRVAEALIGGEQARTYAEVAKRLGVHVGTVHRHLGRIRERHPDAYALLMAQRQTQLAVRHSQALSRARAHSERWHRKQANRRYFYRFGIWPHERRQGVGPTRRPEPPSDLKTMRAEIRAMVRAARSG